MSKQISNLPERIKTAPEYRGYNIQDLESLMAPGQLSCANTYISTGGNATAAARESRKLVDNAKVYKPSEKGAEQKNCSALAYKFLGQSLVVSYLYLKLEQLRESGRKQASRGFEQYLATFENIRDAAIENEDFTPALQAHRDIGKILGHTQEDNTPRGISDSQLIAIIAAGDARLEKVLNKRMGIKVIEHDSND